MHFLKTSTLLGGVTGLAFALPTLGQQSNVFDQTDTAGNAVEALEEQVSDDFKKARDGSRFGNSYRRKGWTGSVSATVNSTGGNSETLDAGIGARFGYASGDWTHDFVLGYNYSESNDVTSDNSFLGAYDVSRDINPNLYAYGKLRTQYDEFGAYDEDYFAGLGLGYRVINNADTTWRVQGGPGWRRTKTSAGVKNEEAAALISSKFYHAINDGLFITNDTDILHSDADTLVSNDLGLNVSLSGPLSIRTSLRTDYHTDPAAGQKNTDYTAGISLVYSFK